jgi:hypothetical protein
MNTFNDPSIYNPTTHCNLTTQSPLMYANMHPSMHNSHNSIIYPPLTPHIFLQYIIQIHIFLQHTRIQHTLLQHTLLQHTLLQHTLLQHTLLQHTCLQFIMQIHILQYMIQIHNLISIIFEKYRINKVFYFK